MMRAAALTAVGVALVLTACAPVASPRSPGSPSAAAPKNATAETPAETNHRLATAEVERLLALAQVPVGATDLTVAPHALTGPVVGMLAATTAIDHARFWHVPMRDELVLAWLEEHPPPGLVVTAGGTTASQNNGRGPVGGFGYAAPPSAAWTEASYQVGVAASADGGSDIRADGIAVWLDPTPLPDAAAGPRVHVDGASGCPLTDEGIVGVTNDRAGISEVLLPAERPTGALVCDFEGRDGRQYALRGSRTLSADDAVQLAMSATASMGPHPDGVVRTCPFRHDSAIVAFSYATGSDIDLWFSGDGCSYVGNGHVLTDTAQPFIAALLPLLPSA